MLPSLLPFVSMKNLFQAARKCLTCTDVDEKLAQAEALARAWRDGELDSGADGDLPAVIEAGRPPVPELVPPRKLKKRKLGTSAGRAAMIHAIAHIEFNAINLACDAVYRFPRLPKDYYGDWFAVAAEEARHFRLLRQRLRDLGYDYGNFPAHNGLWELAQQTAKDPLVRMALVPRVMEARGLDVTPAIMEKFREVNDHETVSVLEVILRDEIGHVEAGSRWFHYLCARRGLDPEPTYFALLQEYLKGHISCPLHVQARLAAGFSETELQRLEALCAG